MLWMVLPYKARLASLPPNPVLENKKGRQGWDKPAFIKGRRSRLAVSAGSPAASLSKFVQALHSKILADIIQQTLGIILTYLLQLRVKFVTKPLDLFLAQPVQLVWPLKFN